MGPPGAPGPGTRLVFDATVTVSGTAIVNLPSEAGTLASPPAVSCYVSGDSGATWAILALDTDTDTDVETSTDFAGFVGCFLDPGPANNISVVAEPLPPGWLLRVVVIF